MFYSVNYLDIFYNVCHFSQYIFNVDHLKYFFFYSKLKNRWYTL